METGGLGGDVGGGMLSIYDSVCGARSKEDLFPDFYKADSLQCSW